MPAPASSSPSTRARCRTPTSNRGSPGSCAEAKDQPHVVKVTPPGDGTVSKDGRIGFATVTYDENMADLGVEPGERLQELAGPLRADGVHVEYGGDIHFTEQEIGGASEMVGLIVAVFVLLIAFGSVVAMGLPLGTALIGLGAGLGLITIGESFVNVPTIAPTLATMIGLGVGIDYALFIVTRHREHLHQGHTVEDAAGRAIATAGQAVLFAGTTVVIAICGLQFVGIPMVSMMGYATAVVVAVSVDRRAHAAAGVHGLRRAQDRLVAGPVRQGQRDRRRARVRVALVAPRRPPPVALPARQPGAARHARRAVRQHPPRHDRRTATTPPTARPASPTTCSPRASAAGSTARSCWRSRRATSRSIR